MPKYRFCPLCGGTLQRDIGQAGEDVLRCTICTEPLYENSKPCAGGLVERDGRVLLVRRAIEPFKDSWDIPGGFLQPGEHPSDGAAREVLEETGLIVRPRELLGIWIDTYGPEEDGSDGGADVRPTYTLNCYYVAELIGGTLRAADDAAELAWFGPDALPRRIAFRHAPAVLTAWRERVVRRSE